MPQASRLVAADDPPLAPAYPLWDGHETIAQYARRVNLPETKKLDLGNSVSLELVLIPAGKFIMGTPEPQPVDEAAFHKKIVTGLAVLAAGGGILLVLIGFAILRAIREKRRFQYSLRRFLAMMFAAGLCVLGGMHWWHSRRELEFARTEYQASVRRLAGAFPWHYNNEKRAHEVIVSKPFYMARYEVTQEQYQSVMGTNPSRFNGAGLPVETVSWEDAQEFCKRLNARDPAKFQGNGPAKEQSGKRLYRVRLPTEAEWEYACRAGTRTAYYSGDKEADLGRIAWYSGNSGQQSHQVGQKEPNAFGLYDMCGNVYEWCQDWYDDYSPGAVLDPKGPARGQNRFSPDCVLRGGCWDSTPWVCRSTSRYWDSPEVRYWPYGFRVSVGITRE